METAKAKPDVNSDIYTALRKPFCSEHGTTDETQQTQKNALVVYGEVTDDGAEQNKRNNIHQFTESDFMNKNVVDDKLLSCSVPNYFDRFSNEGL